MADKKIKLNWYQDKFLFSAARYSACIAGVGTGKTYIGTLKMVTALEKYPNSLGLIVRKEYRDLKMSTIKDFESNFGVKINSSDKSYTFPNGSQIMFSHGDLTDINVLKNINLSRFLIEQAEEYVNADIFHFLRDRLRRQGAPRGGDVIANANGHNWIYDLFLDKATVQVHDEATGESVYEKESYLATTANTFANEHNLPADYVDDLRNVMSKDAPNHYKQFVLNDHNIIDADDLVFSHELLASAKTAEFSGTSSRRIFGADISRYGDNKCVMVILEDCGGYKWRVLAVESWQGKDAVHTIGRIAELARTFHAAEGIIDCDGLGGPYYDVLKDLSKNIKLKEFNNTGEAADTRHYANPRTQAYFELKGLMEKGWLRVENPQVLNELAEIRYTYNTKDQKILISKEALRRQGYKSPDYADALAMAGTLFKSSPASPLRNMNGRRIIRFAGPQVDY